MNYKTKLASIEHIKNNLRCIERLSKGTNNCYDIRESVNEIETEIDSWKPKQDGLKDEE